MKVSLIAGSLLIAAVTSSAALAQEKKTVLTIDTARKMAAACVAKAKAEGWRMNIAILDDGGNLKYFERMDGSFMGSIQIAQLKATGALRDAQFLRCETDRQMPRHGLEMLEAADQNGIPPGRCDR